MVTIDNSDYFGFLDINILIFWIISDSSDIFNNYFFKALSDIFFYSVKLYV